MKLRRTTRELLTTSIRRLAVPAAGLWLAAAALAGCGIEERTHASQAAAQPSESPTDVYAWPEGEVDIAVLELRDRGEIHLALYPQLAPRNVASFVSLAENGFYDGVTFHRVIRDFVVQAGDPLTRDDDPANDGRGGLDYSIDDEFSDAPLVRGVVAVANEGRPNSGGSQFFIMHKDRRGLDGQYSVFGRVVAGIHLVDDVALTETDVGARWGPAHRPLEDIVIERIRIERAAAGRDTAIADSGGGAGISADGGSVHR